MQDQVRMIGNVFYNLLNHVGVDKQDPKILELSKQVKSMMQERRFDNLMGLKVPHLKQGVMNLLSVVDLPYEDRVELMKIGYGDILRNPTVAIQGQDSQKDQLDLQVEATDPLQACTIAFKFVVMKTSVHASSATLPKRVYFQMRFFSFPEVHTDSVSLYEPGFDRRLQKIAPGRKYYLNKERISDFGHFRGEREPSDPLSDANILSVLFEVDPSCSKIDDEHLKLAEYMKDRYLTVDIFDADTKFLFAVAKLPLFELLRQRRTSVVCAKEIEASAPDSAEFRCALQIIMSN